MFPAWRFQLREARLAMADGRWDEAAEMLTVDPLKEFLPAKRLSQELAGQLVTRARQRMELGNSTAGWRDLDRAARLGAGESAITDVRREQATQRLRRVQELLAQGDATAARQALARMDHHRLGGEQRRTWQVIAQHAENAQQRARRGDMASAIESLDHAQRLLPADASTEVSRHFQERSASLHDAATKIHAFDAALHAALASSTWTEVLRASESLLELAPQHSAARQARHRAWQAVGMEVTLPYRPAVRQLPRPRIQVNGGMPLADSTRPVRNGKVDTVINEHSAGKRVVA